MQKGVQCQHGLQHMSIALAAADGPIGGLCGRELQVHTMSFAANIWFWGAWSLQDRRGFRGKNPGGSGGFRGVPGGSGFTLPAFGTQKCESGGHVAGVPPHVLNILKLKKGTEPHARPWRSSGAGGF